MSKNALDRTVDLGEKILALAKRECGDDGHLCLRALLSAAGAHMSTAPPELRALMPPPVVELERMIMFVSGLLMNAALENEAESQNSPFCAFEMASPTRM